MSGTTSATRSPATPKPAHSRAALVTKRKKPRQSDIGGHLRAGFPVHSQTRAVGLRFQTGEKGGVYGSTRKRGRSISVGEEVWGEPGSDSSATGLPPSPVSRLQDITGAT